MDFSFLDDDDVNYDHEGPFSTYTNINYNRPAIELAEATTSSSSIGIQNLAIIDSLDLPVGTMTDPKIQQLLEIIRQLSQNYSVICDPQMREDRECLRIYLRGNSKVTLTEVKLAIFSWFKQNSQEGFLSTSQKKVTTTTTHADIVANLLLKNLGSVQPRSSTETQNNNNSIHSSSSASSSARNVNGPQKTKCGQPPTPRSPTKIARTHYDQPCPPMTKKGQSRYDSKWRNRFKPSHKMTDEEINSLATTQWQWPTQNGHPDDNDGEPEEEEDTEYPPPSEEEWPSLHEQQQQPNFGHNEQQHHHQPIMTSGRGVQMSTRRFPLSRQYYNTVPPPPSLSISAGHSHDHDHHQQERVRRPSPVNNFEPGPPERLMRSRYLVDSQKYQQQQQQNPVKSSSSPSKIVRIPRDRLSCSSAFDSQASNSRVHDNNNLPWARSGEALDLHFPLPSSSAASQDQDDDYWA